MAYPPSVAESLQTIELELLLAAKAEGSAPKAPQIIAVSKMQSATQIEEALAAGHRHFGENRVQEAAGKWPALRLAYPDVVLHLIGPLQSNKAAEAVTLFDWIHSIDRPKIAQAVRDACAAQGKDIRCLIQVNTGEEPQKAGVAPPQLAAFAEECKALGLCIEGLMCIPPVDANPAPHFALLAKLAGRHGLAQLSMGMSGDYRIAASLGASFVRIGSAIFGARP